MIRKLMLLLCFGLVVTAVLYAANKEQERLENSGVVMQEIMSVPDNIPQEVIEKAECVIVFPSVLKAAFVVGASYGRGAMVCRTGKNFRGPWGAPAMYALEGGSVGFQIGGQATDLVLLVMNERGADSILNSKVKLGGDASVAAGPVGRDASANTDAYMRAEILSYSRSRGLFAGISLDTQLFALARSFCRHFTRRIHASSRRRRYGRRLRPQTDGQRNRDRRKGRNSQVGPSLGCRVAEKRAAQ